MSEILKDEFKADPIVEETLTPALDRISQNPALCQHLRYLLSDLPTEGGSWTFIQALKVALLSAGDLNWNTNSHHLYARMVLNYEHQPYVSDPALWMQRVSVKFG